MQEKLIEFNTAVLAKEKGFNIPCNTHCFIGNTGKIVFEKSVHCIDWGNRPNVKTIQKYSRPTQSLLAKWLREVHNCIIEITFYGENIISLDDIKYEVEIEYYGKNFNFIGDSSDYYSNDYDTYEEALEVGLFNALKLIK